MAGLVLTEQLRVYYTAPRTGTGPLGILLARHEALRTRFVRGEPPTQVVCGPGVAVVDVLRIEPELAGGESAEVQHLLAQYLRVKGIDIEAAPPIRLAVAMSDGGAAAGDVPGAGACRSGRRAPVGLLHSTAGGRALARIAARAGGGRQTVLLAAVCTVLSVRTGMGRFVFSVSSGNRFRGRPHDYVGALAQDGLLALDIAGDSFDDVVRGVVAATPAANTHAGYDIVALREARTGSPTSAAWCSTGTSRSTASAR